MLTQIALPLIEKQTSGIGFTGFDTLPVVMNFANPLIAKILEQARKEAGASAAFASPITEAVEALSYLSTVVKGQLLKSPLDTLTPEEAKPLALYPQHLFSVRKPVLITVASLVVYKGELWMKEGLFFPLLPNEDRREPLQVPTGLVTDRRK